MKQIIKAFSRTLAAIAFASVAVFPVHAQAPAPQFTMKVGMATMNDIQHFWGTSFKEAIEARSKGRIEVKVFPRGQLGTIASQAASNVAITGGTIDNITLDGGTF